MRSILSLVTAAMLLAACGAPTPTAVVVQVAPNATEVWSTESPATAVPAPKPTDLTTTTVPTPKPTAVTATTLPAPKPTGAPATLSPAPKPTDPPATAPDLTPKVRTVWNTAIGSNKMEGTCAGTAILPAYGQVQITPSADALEWKNQQTTYAFKRVGPGQWHYAGPSPLNDGTVDLLLTFKDDKNLIVVHKLVPAKDAGCTHTFTYNGTFMWERP